MRGGTGRFEFQGSKTGEWARFPAVSHGRRGLVWGALFLSCLLCGPFACASSGATSVYVFQPERSTVLQTGGIAGVHWKYRVEGQFRLRVDSDARTASFDRVDANATDDSPYKRTLDPNQVFNLTRLTGRVVDETSIRFEGKADDGSSVLTTLTFADGTVTLKGQTTPPPHSADFFVFALDAIAQRKYAGGAGEPNNPYLICTAEQLNAIGAEPNDWDKHFQLMADINLVDLAGTQFNMIGYWRGPTDFRAFTGKLDGNGHRILNSTCHADANDAVGLLGYVSGPRAEIENLTLVDPNVKADGADSVGSLVGLLRDGTVRSCHVVRGNVFGRYEVGGLVGSCDKGNVIVCSAIGTVRGGSGIGGLVGHCSGGAIRQSAAGGSVVSYGSVDAVGGLVGSTGILSYTNIANCCSWAKVIGTYYVGGLVGTLAPGSGVTNCYSAGAVSGTTCVGGLIGFAGNVVGYKPDVKASFWDVEASGQTRSAGGMGRTTAEMQKGGTFLAAGWDFVGEATNGTEDIWWIFEGRDYPRLWWERVLEDDFEDGKAEPLWMRYEPWPEAVRLKEVHGRLEVEAGAQPENVDAIYVPNGWRLDATKDFALRVDFHFSERGPGDGRVTLGVVPSLDPAGMQWAEFEAGCFDSGPFYLYEVRDKSWVQEREAARFADDGTLFVSYNSDTDELYFSYTGYGKPNAWQTVPGLLKGRWAAEAVHVILSGGSEGLALGAGDAWLDDFTVNTGVVQAVEPPVLPSPDGGE